MLKKAAGAGLEPAPSRSLAERSTAELPHGLAKIAAVLLRVRGPGTKCVDLRLKKAVGAGFEPAPTRVIAESSTSELPHDVVIVAEGPARVRDNKNQPG